MMFYTTVCGWMLRYFVDMAKGDFVGLDTAGVEQHFNTMLGDAGMQVIYMGIAVVLGFAVCAIGLQNGLEKITKFMMIALLMIMIVLAINSIFMDGGEEGLAFYLLPSLERMQDVGIANVIVAALNQAFFTLSLGMGAMAIFGSYINKERTLMGEAVNVALLDTFVALASGLIMFPACFAYGVEVNSGPPLIFITLPNIFNHIPLGRLWGSLFFVFMSFAALSTVLTVFEGILSCTMDMFGWSRKKSCLLNGILLFLLSLPCALGFNLLSGFQPFGEGSSILDLEDFIVSNLILPLGSLVFVLFCTSKRGWGWDKFTAEANSGKGIRVQSWMRFYLTYILPVIILILFVIGIWNFFR
jgi:NSS family neurotransmitter:Na+ symporter